MLVVETIYEKLKVVPPEVASQVLEFLASLEASARVTEPPDAPNSFEFFYGCLTDSKTFEGDPVEIQRRFRGGCDR